ncbi:TPA: DUF3265 domain-containing protein, partial [Vibrio vulnificus]|nr:DUF3265 domain-containing protein [Vibrio vulnificus]
MSACPNTGVESCVDERRGKKQ